MQHFKIINSLDIGTSKITAITGQFPENETKINIVGVASIPAVGFKKGQIINLEQASKTITECIESTERMAGFQINHAYVCLTAPHLESINSKGQFKIFKLINRSSLQNDLRVVFSCRLL